MIIKSTKTAKKAQIFSTLLVLMTLIVCSYILFSLIKYSTKSSFSLASPEPLAKIYNEKQKFIFSADDAAELSMSQAYYEIIKNNEFGSNDCQVVDDYVDFSSSSSSSGCSFAADVNEKFSGYFKDKFDKIIKEYPSEFKDITYAVNFDGKEIKVTGEKTIHLAVTEGFFPFGAEYNFNLNIIKNLHNMGLEDFSLIYDKANECKTQADVATCMNFDNFDVAAVKENGKIYFDLKSKKKFFYSDSADFFQPFEIKFIMPEA